MKYISIRVYAHAFDRKSVNKTLNAVSRTIENHLIKLSVGEDLYKRHWAKEISDVVNKDLEFVIKKGTSITTDGVYSVLFKEKSNQLSSRIKNYCQSLMEDGYAVKSLSEEELQLLIENFKRFYQMLSEALVKRYSSRKKGIEINVIEILRKVNIS